MKTNKFVFALSLACVLTLGSCDKNGDPDPARLVTELGTHPIIHLNEDGQELKLNDPDDPANSKLVALNVKNKAVSLFYGVNSDSGQNFAQTIKLDFVATPNNANLTGIKWASSNPAVATVDETGFVTAVSEGMADITLSNADGSISSKSHVVVTKQDKVNTIKRKNEIVNAQNATDFKQANNIYVIEDYEDTKSIVGGAVQSSHTFTDQIWASKESAYFRIVENETATKVEAGSDVLGRVDYIFYTTNDFYTYVFKTDGNKRNYMRVDQSSLVNEGGSRFDALTKVIGNFFVAGASIITQQFETALGTDALGKASIWSGKRDNEGRIKDLPGQLAISYSSETKDFPVGQEDADYFGVPLGTKISVVDKIGYLWEDNKVSTKTISETIDYSLSSVQYSEVLNVNYYFQHENVELFWPDATQYNKVDTIFDL